MNGWGADPRSECTFAATAGGDIANECDGDGGLSLLCAVSRRSWANDCDGTSWGRKRQRERRTHRLLCSRVYGSGDWEAAWRMKQEQTGAALRVEERERERGYRERLPVVTTQLQNLVVLGSGARLTWNGNSRLAHNSALKRPANLRPETGGTQTQSRSLYY
jgi:hypothetical protein